MHLCTAYRGGLIQLKHVWRIFWRCQVLILIGTVTWFFSVPLGNRSDNSLLKLGHDVVHMASDRLSSDRTTLVKSAFLTASLNGLLTNTYTKQIRHTKLYNRARCAVVSVQERDQLSHQQWPSFARAQHRCLSSSNCLRNVLVLVFVKSFFLLSRQRIVTLLLDLIK